MQYAVPLFVIAVLAEMIWAKFRTPEAYEPKDTLVSLAFGLGSTVAGALLGGFALTVFIETYQYRLFDFGPEWWAVWWAWPHRIWRVVHRYSSMVTSPSRWPVPTRYR